MVRGAPTKLLTGAAHLWYIEYMNKMTYTYRGFAIEIFQSKTGTRYYIVDFNANYATRHAAEACIDRNLA